MTSQSPAPICDFLESLSIQEINPSPTEEKSIQETCLKAQVLRQISEIIPEISSNSSQEIITTMRDKLLAQVDFTIGEVKQVLFAAITAKQTISPSTSFGPRIGPNGFYG